MSDTSDTTTTAETPRRLRAVDVIENQNRLIAQLLTHGSGERSSVTLTRNAKGETQIEVIVRTDEHETTTAADAMAKARELYEAACSAYPAGSGFVRNEGQNVRPTGDS